MNSDGVYREIQLDDDFNDSLRITDWEDGHFSLVFTQTSYDGDETKESTMDVIIDEKQLLELLQFILESKGLKMAKALYGDINE